MVNWKHAVVTALLLAGAATGYATASDNTPQTRTVTVTKVIHAADPTARKIGRRALRAARHAQVGVDLSNHPVDLSKFENRLGAAEQNAGDAIAKVRNLNVGTFPNGQAIVVRANREDGTESDTPQVVFRGTTVFRYVNCPDGSALMSGGYTVIGAGPFGQSPVFFSHPSGNGWAVGIDNAPNSHDVKLVEVEAMCVPGMVAQVPSDHSREIQLVADQIASHN